MIIEPRKSAEEIDRCLSALTDPELSDLLKDLNQGFLGDDHCSWFPLIGFSSFGMVCFVRWPLPAR